MLYLTYLLHDLREVGAEGLLPVVVKDFLESDILKCHQRRLQHVQTSLVRKCEYWR